MLNTYSLQKVRVKQDDLAKIKSVHTHTNQGFKNYLPSFLHLNDFASVRGQHQAFVRNLCHFLESCTRVNVKLVLFHYSSDEISARAGSLLRKLETVHFLLKALLVKQAAIYKCEKDVESLNEEY